MNTLEFLQLQTSDWLWKCAIISSLQCNIQCTCSTYHRTNCIYDISINVVWGKCMYIFVTICYCSFEYVFVVVQCFVQCMARPIYGLICKLLITWYLTFHLIWHLRFNVVRIYEKQFQFPMYNHNSFMTSTCTPFFFLVKSFEWLVIQLFVLGRNVINSLF